MAHWHGLNARPAALPLAVIMATVLLAHLGALAWIGRHLSGPPAVRQMAEPLFTRLLAPTEPPPPAPVASRPAPQARRMTASLATAPNARPAASRAKPAPLPASAPAPEPAPSQAIQPETPGAAPGTQAGAEPQSPVPASSSALAQPAQEADAAADRLLSSEPLPPAIAPAVAAQAPVPASPAPGPADLWPADTRLSYTLQGEWRGGPIYGSARVQWQRQAAQYQAQVIIEVLVFGRRVMTSQGEVTPQGLVPRVYEEQTRSRRRTARMTDTEVVLSDGRSVPRPPRLQDTASQFVELGYRFATGQQVLALGESIQVWLARPGGVDLWTYDVVAQDLLATSRFGEVVTWRLRPRPLANPRGRITAEVWFAPSLQYLPARIRVTEGEDIQIDLVVETIEQR